MGTYPLTPVERVEDVWVKRDDLFEVFGATGGKARTCHYLATRDPNTKGLVTAGSRDSGQLQIVAKIAQGLGIPCRCFVPTGTLTPEIKAAWECGAEVAFVRPGYGTVIAARAREYAEAGVHWVYVPFRMECQEAVEMTAEQVENVPVEIKRIVAPVGSGMSFAGICKGRRRFGLKVPTIGIQVGADPSKRLERFIEPFDPYLVFKSPFPYHQRIDASIGPIHLDPVYEAKCLPFLQEGDLLWIVGHRGGGKNV